MTHSNGLKSVVSHDYEIWFQDGNILMIISARNNSEARRKFNKQISVKQRG